MRIIGGKYRAKILKSPKTGVVRPTSDRAREALFNILNSKLSGNWENYRFLDVFAGTGAIGFEALSRGVQKVGFIDINTDNLRQNIALFPQEKEKIKIYKTSVANLNFASEKYNLIFMDAPYEKGLSEIALQQLCEKKWLDETAMIIVETQKNESFEVPELLEIVDERIYGPAKFRFLEYFFDKKLAK